MGVGIISRVVSLALAFSEKHGPWTQKEVTRLAWSQGQQPTEGPSSSLPPKHSGAACRPGLLFSEESSEAKPPVEVERGAAPAVAITVTFKGTLEPSVFAKAGSLSAHQAPDASVLDFDERGTCTSSSRPKAGRPRPSPRDSDAYTCNPHQKTRV